MDLAVRSRPSQNWRFNRALLLRSPIRIITSILPFVKMISGKQNFGKEEILMNVLERMEKLGLKQVDMILELRVRGIDR